MQQSRHRRMQPSRARIPRSALVYSASPLLMLPWCASRV
jgi:hypothetical protein